MALTRAQQERALALAREQKRRKPWRPLPGPQTMAYESKADIIGYGGAAGGGKTDLIAGLSLTKHKRVLIVRREKAQTEGVIQRFGEIVGDTTGFNGQKSVWRVGVGSQPLIEFGGLDNPGDERRWQGRPHDAKCVAAGTLVWMADGSRKPIERVAVGDFVDTLEGPRQVTRTMTSHRPAVRVTTPVGEQVQGATHELLRASGVFASCPCPSEPASHTAPPFGRRYDGWCEPTCSGSSLSPADLWRGRPPSPVPERYPGDRRFLSGSPGGRASKGGGDAPAASSGTPLARALRALSRRAFQGLRELALRAMGCETATRRDVCGEQQETSPPGFRGRCSCAPRRGGGRLLLVAADGQQGLRRSDGVGRRTPSGWRGDVQGTTPKRTPRTWSYVHPYSKETRQTARGARVVSFACSDAGSLPLYDLTVEGANHYLTGPGFANRNCFDEVTEMREAQVRFIMGWTRTSDPKLTARALMTFNPPTTTEGRWVIKFFAPWLEKGHRNPAVPGELRWFTTKGKDQDYEVATGDPFVWGEDGEPIYGYDPASYKPEQIIKPKSRTFIPARLTDNRYYMATDYMAQLQALPEPLRSQMLNGDFQAGVEDDAMQVIPTAWVEAAMARWKPKDVKPPMDSLGCDVARGGADNTVISRRHGWWFDELLAYPGTATPDGPTVAGLCIAALRDLAPIHIDVIGVGASPYDFLRQTHQTVGVIAGEAASGTDKSGRLKFFNERSKEWWMMRELLDPTSNSGVALPNDKRLLADLCAPLWRPQGDKIKVESRDEIIDRIGRSPDYASAVLLAALETPKRSMMPGYDKQPQAEYDPYGGMRAQTARDYDPHGRN